MRPSKRTPVNVKKRKVNLILKKRFRMEDQRSHPPIAILPLLSVTQAALIEIRTARSAEVSGCCRWRLSHRCAGCDGGTSTSCYSQRAGMRRGKKKKKEKKRRFTRFLLSDSRRHEQLASPRMPPPLPSPQRPEVKGRASVLAPRSCSCFRQWKKGK